MNKSDTILRARAIAAAKVEASNILEDGINLLHFRIGKEKYAIESEVVSEVYPSVSLTPVPYTPSYIQGIFHIRGRFVSVVNLNDFFGIEKMSEDQTGFIVLLGHGEMEFGVVVDDVMDQSELSRKQLQMIPSDFDFPRADLVLGMSEEGVIVFDGKKLMADSAMKIQTEV